MVLELLTAYSVIIAVIVGTGQALQSIDAQRIANDTKIVPEVAANGSLQLNGKSVPIDRLTDLTGVLSSEKPEATQIKNDLDSNVRSAKEEVSPTPISLENHGVETSIREPLKSSQDQMGQTPDVFEAVGFDDVDDDFDKWAK